MKKQNKNKSAVGELQDSAKAALDSVVDLFVIPNHKSTCDCSYCKKDKSVKTKSVQTKTDQTKRKHCEDRDKDSESLSQSEKKRDEKRTPEKMAGAAGGGAAASGSLLDKTGQLGSEELDDLGNDELRKIANETLGEEGVDPDDPTYSGSVRKVKGNTYPYILYIQRGSEKRERISKAHFNAFEEHLWNERLNLSPEQNAKITIDWVLHRGDYGIVATMDSHSAAIVKNIAAGFLFEGESTRGWARWERGTAWVYNGFLHGNLWKKKSPTFYLKKILQMNGLEGEFNNLLWDTKCPNGVFISFEPQGQLIQDLDKKMRLNAGICTLQLKKRFRRCQTEEEILKKGQKKA